MQSNHALYDPTAGLSRLDEILAAADVNFEEVDSIPNRDRLTFTNGFYVNCSALFVDIRRSAALNTLLTRPNLSRLYRSYISEVVAVINGNYQCSEINIVGDCVAGIINTPLKSDIDTALGTAANVCSVINILNKKLVRKGLSPIDVGVGLSWGRALMIKAGFAGSGINDVVYMGPVVNEASHLCNHGSETTADYRLMISNVIYNNLNDHNKSLMSKNYRWDCFHGAIVNPYFESLLKD